MNPEKISQDELCQMVDHTYLKAFATRKDFEKLCSEAREYHFRMVAINSGPVRLCKELLKGTDVHVGAAISFPLGQMSIEGKAEETKLAIDDGADEIDYVLNVGKLIEGDLAFIRKEMETIVFICRQAHVLCKVIFEICYLNEDQIKKAAMIAKEVEPDFIKTSTGFGTSGATVQAVRLMKKTVGAKVKVKAAGGIGNWEEAKAMMEAGAERIGTSKGVQIIQEFAAETHKER
jgi:deoxyribose-phosphate aldolase